MYLLTYIYNSYFQLLLYLLIRNFVYTIKLKNKIKSKQKSFVIILRASFIIILLRTVCY